MARIIVPEAEALLDQEIPVLDRGFVRLIEGKTKHHQVIEAALVHGYSVNLETGRVIGVKGAPLSEQTGANGYKQVGICLPGLRRQGYPIQVHKMVAFAKWGDAAFAPGVDVRHLNGSPTDNRISNLALGSRSENCWDKSDAARKRPGILAAVRWTGHPNVNRKLSDEQVLDIYRRGLNGRRGVITALAREYGVSHSRISGIVAGKAYPSVTAGERSAS